MENNEQTTNNFENKYKMVSIDDFERMSIRKEDCPVAIPMVWMAGMKYLNENWGYLVSEDGLTVKINHVSVWLVSELIEHFKQGFRFAGNSWDVLVVLMGPLENTIRLKVKPLQTDNKMNIRYKVNERNEGNERNERNKKK